MYFVFENVRILAVHLDFNPNLSWGKKILKDLGESTISPLELTKLLKEAYKIFLNHIL